MKLSYKRFVDLLHTDKCVYFESFDCEELSAFAIVEDFAIRLICVTPSKQGQGIGTKLVSDIEEYARNKGYDKLLTGGVTSHLFIGATLESWGFFEKLGFEAKGGCDEMLMHLNDFHIDQLKLHGSDIAEYGFYDGGREELLTAVASVEEDWSQYFGSEDLVYVAKVDGKIASFCIVETNAQNYLTDKYGKVGLPGCVGTVPEFRNKGIALEMVARVTDYLKNQGMDISFIYFTGVATWYEKIGYKTFLSERFGVKFLTL